MTAAGASKTTGRRIMYFIYMNPGAYPPLVHSTRILADAGANILILGTGAFGAGSLELPVHPRIRTRLLAFQSAGWRQKLHYLFFCLWVTAWVIRFRPAWVYASDPFASPAGLLATFFPGVKVVYHEHDSPSSSSLREPKNAALRFVYWARRRIARRAAICVLPQADRARIFAVETGCTTAPVCVWNCPRTDEAVASVARNPDGPLRLAYFGTIVRVRIPEALIDVVAKFAPNVTLRIAGYETIDSRGYGEQLMKRAETMGVSDLVEFAGPISRAELLDWARPFDVGLALMPMESQDQNMQFMVGASNKAFDYMACGLALLTSDLPEWREMYAAPGYAIVCDPRDAESIAGAVQWFLENRNAVARMGGKGQARIREDWNYESCFEPVRRRLLA